MDFSIGSRCKSRFVQFGRYAFELTAVATSGVVRKILPIIQPIPPNAKIPKPGVNISLRPAGTVELEDGTRIDVVTRGEYIEKGEPVQVTRKDGTWLVVEKRRIKE